MRLRDFSHLCFWRVLAADGRLAEKPPERPLAASAVTLQPLLQCQPTVMVTVAPHLQDVQSSHPAEGICGFLNAVAHFYGWELRIIAWGPRACLVPGYGFCYVLTCVVR